MPNTAPSLEPGRKTEIRGLLFAVGDDCYARNNHIKSSGNSAMVVLLEKWCDKRYFPRFGTKLKANMMSGFRTFLSGVVDSRRHFGEHLPP